MLAENKKELSLRKGGRGKIAEKMRNMRHGKSAGKDEEQRKRLEERGKRRERAEEA